jgi:hypothetical protein
MLEGRQPVPFDRRLFEDGRIEPLGDGRASHEGFGEYTTSRREWGAWVGQQRRHLFAEVGVAPFGTVALVGGSELLADLRSGREVRGRAGLGSSQG